ncbi:MAG: hypothetical protein HYX82_04695 [Chloroflexi bacterium]|nr:hypothetical protein [Chloroflexota bacterium]
MARIPIPMKPQADVLRSREFMLLVVTGFLILAVAVLAVFVNDRLVTRSELEGTGFGGLVQIGPYISYSEEISLPAFIEGSAYSVDISIKDDTLVGAGGVFAGTLEVAQFASTIEETASQAFIADSAYAFDLSVKDNTLGEESAAFSALGGMMAGGIFSYAAPMEFPGESTAYAVTEGTTMPEESILYSAPSTPEVEAEY